METRFLDGGVGGSRCGGGDDELVLAAHLLNTTILKEISNSTDAAAVGAVIAL